MAWRNSGRVYLLMVFLPPQMVYSHLGASARLFVGLWFLVFIATERKRPIDFGDPKNFPKAKLFSSPDTPSSYCYIRHAPLSSERANC